MGAIYFPLADASEAMSNWLDKPSHWMESCRASAYAPVRAITHLQFLISRVATAVLAVIAAPMDSFYNAVWFAIKAVVVLCGRDSGLFFRHDVGVHFYKCVVFAAAFFAAPVIAVVSPAYLQAGYRSRGLIV